MPGKKTQVATSLPDYLQVKLRRICDFEGTSMSSFIAEAVNWYCDKWIAKNKTEEPKEKPKK